MVAPDEAPSLWGHGWLFAGSFVGDRPASYRESARFGDPGRENLEENLLGLC